MSIKRIVLLTLICCLLVTAQTVKNTGRYYALSPHGFLIASQTGGISAQTVYNTGVASPAGDVTIRLSIGLTCLSTASATAFTRLTYTNASNTAITRDLSTANCATLNTASEAQDTVLLQIRGNTNVQAQVVATGTPVYRASMLIEQIN